MAMTNSLPTLSVSPFREFWDPDERLVNFTPFGGSTALNVIDYYPGELESQANVSSYNCWLNSFIHIIYKYVAHKVLFLDSGDMRNALLTASKLPDEKFLSIQMVDSHMIITARNVLIVHIILSTDFDAEKDEDLDYLWHLWYSFAWEDKTRKRFVRDVKRYTNYF